MSAEPEAVAWVRLVAERLGDMVDEVVFLGGTVRLVTGPCFLATKLEAFLERGDGDYQLSHDIEDVIAVVDGRTELLEEIKRADPDVRDYLQQTVGELLSDESFRNAVPGHMPGDAGSQLRVPGIVGRLEQIARGT
jgi:hypothetical protein